MRLGIRARGAPSARVWDVVLAVVLAATSVVPVVGGDPSWGTPRALGLTLALASTVPVAWRSSRPILATSVVLVANAACVYAATPHQAAFQPFVALVLVAYSLGARAQGPRALWASGILAVLAVPLFAISVIVNHQDAGNAVPSYVWLVAAWLVGRTVGDWRQKSYALEAANRELADQRETLAEAAVAVERGRIARELHDVVAHNVSMMVVQAGAAARLLEGDQPHVRDALDVIGETGRQTVDEMRTLLGVLRSDDGSHPLRPQPGIADLDQLIAGVCHAGLPVVLRVEGEPRALPNAIDLSAYRIVQEALTNTLKHAGPARAEVVVRYAEASVELEIADTGTAGGTRAAGTGNGLVGMRERVAMFGGELFAAPEPNGFRVRALLPFAQPRLA